MLEESKAIHCSDWDFYRESRMPACGMSSKLSEKAISCNLPSEAACPHAACRWW